MTTTLANGRLGNQIIRNLAVSLIAEKHNMYVNYVNHGTIEKLGIQLYSGELKFEKTEELNDENYVEVYNADVVDWNLNPNKNYFQTKEIIQILYNYLHSEAVKSRIISHNVFASRYNSNNDVFIHVRLTDVARMNPGIDYYLKAIRRIDSFCNLYVSTDDWRHNIIKTIKENYPNMQLVVCDEITTFQFASTCKHIILSHGSFSAIIGYLSYFSNIYYPEYDENKMWYGDMFSIDGWTRI